MRLKLTVDLVSLREKLNAKIDAAAEKARARYITIGAGQTFVYQQKEREAELITANPDISPELVPHLAREAVRWDITLLETAQVVLTMRQIWQGASADIEDIRLSAKERIEVSNIPADIEEIANTAINQLVTGP